MKNPLLFYKLIITFYIILLKTQIISGNYINLQHGDHSINISPQYDIPQAFLTDILCPPGIIGTYLYPFDSFNYIECLGHTTFIQSCPYDIRFNATLVKCATVNKQQPGQLNNNHLQQYLYKCPLYAQGQYFYPFSASKYIKCTSGKLKVINCGPLEVFSISQRICLPEINLPHADYVHTSTPNQIDHSNDQARQDDIIYCEREWFGLYPHPFSNVKYLKCVYGRLYEKSCRSEFVYKISSKMCEKNSHNLFETLPPFQDLYTTDTKIEIRSNDSLTFLKCPADLNGTFIHPFDCTKYINCSFAATKIETCSMGKIYSFRNAQCEFENTMDEHDHVECIRDNQSLIPEETFSSSLGVYCPSTVSMTYPHPNNWYKYVLCNDGKLQVKWCPRDEVFDRESRKCISVSEALNIKN